MAKFHQYVFLTVRQTACDLLAALQNAIAKVLAIHRAKFRNYQVSLPMIYSGDIFKLGSDCLGISTAMGVMVVMNIHK